MSDPGFLRKLIRPYRGSPPQPTSRLGDLKSEIATKHGTDQARRFEQAADSVDLGRFSDDALRQTFGRSDTGLYTTMPPGDFEKFASMIPGNWTQKTPYYKWFYDRDRPLLRENQTYPAYMDRLNFVSQHQGGLDEVPFLSLSPSEPFRSVVGHEGRHRMRMLNEGGERDALVHLRPENFGRYDDRVERLMKQYFPQGSNTPYVPQGDDVRPMIQFPKPVFEQGGPVDTPTEGEGGIYGAPDSMFNTPESLAAALYPQHNTAYGGGGPVDTPRPSDAYFNDLSVGTYRPLNFESLIGSGAARITQPGDGRGGYTASDDPEQWSLVTHANDTHPDSVTRAWPDKPSAHGSAFGLLNDPRALYDGKYRQLIWSAKQRGMADKDIYLPSEHYPQHDTAYAEGGEVEMAGGGADKIKDAVGFLRRLANYKDAPSKHIDDYQWKPMSEVGERLGHIDAIPPHVENFGAFMQEQAQRAANEGLTPRDLLKAFGISRGSIQRSALPTDSIRATGLDIPGNAPTIRPEGAFATWMGTKPGQSWLDKGQSGIVDFDAINDAQQRLAPFGKSGDLAQFLQWGPENLPGREGRLSELVDRARTPGNSSPEEWKDAVGDLFGIGLAKRGFFSAMLGRGDQPVFDARQIDLNVPKGNYAGKYERRGNTEGGDEIMARLAARQNALGIGVPKDLMPFQQYLTHHTTWDKLGNEATTHQDLIDSLRGHAEGGPIEMSTGGQYDAPESEGDGFFRRNDVGDMYAGPVQTVKRLIMPHARSESRVVPNRDIESRYWDHKKPPNLDTIFGEYADHPPVDVPTMKIEDIAGGRLIAVPHDRSATDVTLHGYNGNTFADPVTSPGGPKFAFGRNPEAVTASGESVIKKLHEAAVQSAEEGRTPYLAPWLMGPHGVDFSTHMNEAVAQSLPFLKVPMAKRDEVNKLLAGVFTDFPGIEDKDLVSYLHNMVGTTRRDLPKLLDKAEMVNAGLDVGGLRAALTDPGLLHAPYGSSGAAISRIDPSKSPTMFGYPTHPSYPWQLQGTPVGGLDPMVPPQILYPDFFRSLPPETHLGPKGKPVNNRRAFEMSSMKGGVGQDVNDEVINKVNEYQEYMRNIRGRKEGGTVEDEYHPIWQQSFAGGGQPEYDPLDRTEDMESTFMFAPRPWMREPQQSDSPGALRRMYDTAKSVAGYVGDGISDAAKNEWERFRGPAKYHPGLYFADAASRADNALKNATEDWTAKDYWDLVTPDMGLRHEYGPMAAPLDVAGIVAAPVMAGGRGLGKATQHAIKYAERDLAPALMKLYGASAAPVATKSAYESYGMAHGGSVEDQYHPIWSQNFAEGGPVEMAFGGGFAPSGGGGMGGGGMPWMSLLQDGMSLGKHIEGGPDQQEQQSGTYPYDPLSGLWQMTDPDLETYDQGELIGGDIGRGVGGVIGSFFGPFQPLFREGLGRIGGGIGAMVQGRFGEGISNMAEGTPLDALFADGGPVKMSFGGGFAPSAPTNDFTEPGMPSFGVGIPGFDVPPLPFNSQVARDKAERERLLRMTEQASQKGLAEQMKPKDSGGGGGGGMDDIMGMAMKMAPQIMSMMASHGGPVGHYADGGSIPEQNGEQPWMYGGGALMARGGYLSMQEGGAPRAYRDDSGNFTYQGNPVQAGDKYLSEGIPLTWARDDVLGETGSVEPDSIYARMQMRGGKQSDFRNARQLLAGPLFAEGGYLRGHGGMNG